MNKPSLIVLVLLITLGIGMSSAYAITITLAGDATVTGGLEVSGDLTGPTIDAINAAIATSASCPEENVQHWDKVIFHTIIFIQQGDIDFNTPQGKTELVIDRPLDVKVLDDPNQLANLEDKVIQKLKTLGYSINNEEEPFIRDLLPNNIIIEDVEYAIVCVQPGPT